MAIRILCRFHKYLGVQVYPCSCITLDIHTTGYAASCSGKEQDKAHTREYETFQKVDLIQFHTI
jgi:hypothetical protein